MAFAGLDGTIDNLCGEAVLMTIDLQGTGQVQRRVYAHETAIVVRNLEYIPGFHLAKLLAGLIQPRNCGEMANIEFVFAK